MNRVNRFALGLAIATQIPAFAMEKTLDTLRDAELCREVRVLGARLIIAADTVNRNMLNVTSQSGKLLAGATHTRVTESTIEQAVEIMALTLGSQRTTTTLDQLRAHRATLQDAVKRQEFLMAFTSDDTK